MSYKRYKEDVQLDESTTANMTVMTNIIITTMMLPMMRTFWLPLQHFTRQTCLIVTLNLVLMRYSRGGATSGCGHRDCRR